MKRLLVTGGMGFVGSNFIRYMLDKYDSRIKIINLDLLTFTGNADNLTGVSSSPNYQFVHGDIADANVVRACFGEGIDTVIHFAADSDVDRSLYDSSALLQTNVIGTHTLLEGAKRSGIHMFVHISSVGVYGSLGAKGFFTERTAASPSSLYTASKAASDFIVRAYTRTYGIPAIITRCSNNYGPYQHPEKLIPTAILRTLQGRKIPIYGKGANIRDWLHVLDHCSAIDAVIQHGGIGEVYNIGGNNERSNLDIVGMILAELGRPSSMIEFIPDRTGHDLRYAINARKLRKETGWQPHYTLAEGIRQTVRWYVDNENWWKTRIFA